MTDQLIRQHHYKNVLEKGLVSRAVSCFVLYIMNEGTIEAILFLQEMKSAYRKIPEV